ncbi:MAG TPA: methyltransferase domain-containing protein [Polyangiaceae bacterium]|nr:methyltransferase domain-containing protein [Polyangiaceae bacterium]
MAPTSLEILGFNTQRSLELLRDGGLRRFGLRRLLGGINFVQSLEFRLALEHLALSGAERVLDVASPKLLAAYLAARGKVAEIVMTDLADPRLSEFRALVPVAQRHRVSCRHVDATALDQCFEPGSFDRVYCLTSLQHFPGDADKLALEQFARVLAPGGRLLVSVPYGPKWGEEPYPELGGTRKRYDEAALEARLSPPGLTLARKIYYGQRWFPIDSFVSSFPKPSLQVLINWLTPLLEPLFWVPCAPERARGVALVYERPARAAASPVAA